MRTTFAFTALVASWTASVLAAPSPAPGEGFIASEPSVVAHDANDTKTYLVLFKQDGINDTAEAMSIKTLIDRLDDIDESIIAREYHAPGLHGAAVNIGEHCAQAMAAMEEVGIVEEALTIKTFEQKVNAPWGLQAISNTDGASGDPQGMNFTYTFADNDPLGAGVDIYMVDTGVRATHAVFGGRVETGFAADGGAGGQDGDGHGTHTAGTAAGARFGVAQSANIIPVRVLGADGSGSTADFIAGVEFVMNSHAQRSQAAGFRGSVMSMSLGLGAGAVSDSVDRVVKQASSQGIHVSLAAGNDGSDACQSSPSSTGGAGSDTGIVSVGSVNIGSQVSTFSNTGQCVDIFAPGEQVLSSWNTGDDVINFLSGTSMACPHVTGTMAYLLAEDASLATDTKGLKAKLLSLGTQNAISGDLTQFGGSPNLFLNNGQNGNVPTGGNASIGRRSARAGSPAARVRTTVQELNSRWTLFSTESALCL